MIRRAFLKRATAVATLAMGAPGWRSLRAAGPGPRPRLPIQIGILLKTFRLGTLESRLDAARAYGIDCVQMSFDCAGLPAMPEAIPPDLAGRIRRAAADREMTIASVEGTFNMSHPDAAERRAGLRRLEAVAEACPALGTSRIHRQGHRAGARQGSGPRRRRRPQAGRSRQLDYDRYVALLHRYQFPGPLLLHGLSEAQVPGCVAFLREKIARLAS